MMALGVSDGSIWVHIGQGVTLALLLVLTWIAKEVWTVVTRRIPKPVEVEETHWRDQRIHEWLTSLRDRLGATRTYFSRFHNGEHYVEGCELLKKTRTHESVRDGMEYQAEHYKGMLVSTVHEEMKLVLEDGPSFVAVHALPNSKFKRLCQIGGARAIARCAVRKAGKIIGFVGIDLDSDERPEGIELVCEYAGRIAELI